MKRDRIVQIVDGVWYSLRGFTHEVCCDCNLVHRGQFRLKDGDIQFRYYRDDKRTRALRKRHKILVLKG